MQPQQTYLKGRSVFIVSLMVIGITVLTVYFTGENYHRTLTSNTYISLSIIGIALFLFMSYGLYKGIGLIDNYPNFKKFKSRELFTGSGEVSDIPVFEVAEGAGGIVVAILAWIGMTLLSFVMIIVLELVFWASIFIILAMLYWVFFRAMKLVFNKSSETKGAIGISVLYALGYTSLYLGWIFGIVYLTTVFV